MEEAIRQLKKANLVLKLTLFFDIPWVILNWIWIHGNVMNPLSFIMRIVTTHYGKKALKHKRYIRSAMYSAVITLALVMLEALGGLYLDIIASNINQARAIIFDVFKIFIISYATYNEYNCAENLLNNSDMDQMIEVKVFRNKDKWKN